MPRYMLLSDEKSKFSIFKRIRPMNGDYMWIKVPLRSQDPGKWDNQVILALAFERIFMMCCVYRICENSHKPLTDAGALLHAM